MSNPQTPAGSIVLIDDDPEQLARLKAEVERFSAGSGVKVTDWKPEANERVDETFDTLVAGGRTLVVTDYDLTRGPAGFFGTSVVSWCQQRAIPVGDYSRGNKPNLPKQPSLFEFRFPETPRQAGQRIVGIHKGFSDLRAKLDSDPNLLSERSPANMLAHILHRPSAIPQFSLYAPQLVANPGLVDLFSTRKDVESRKELAAYLLGHLLFNSILRYPGPILDPNTLCSYLACDGSEADAVQPLFQNARYNGPFDSLGPRYWREDVDDVIESLAEKHDVPYDGNVAGYRRALVERELDRELLRYGCPRCQGERGGFRCPFTEATVCELSECSVGSSAWLPPGADLVRVERGYFDETAPMMGR
ncbi:MAG: hypothetical protein QOG72_1062 [Sphingomonadales bacterium]|nr:hypothetical protein [Sphingomonadales bacterium]